MMVRQLFLSEVAKMIRSTGFHLISTVGILLLLLLTTVLVAQDTSNFYEVDITKSEFYSYTDLKFAGDYTSFRSAAGHLALGRTEAGVTILIVVGDGTLNITAPEAGVEKFKTVFGNYPMEANFTSIYMRLHPKEFEEVFGKLSLKKAPDDSSFTKAKELFDQDFVGSYHAGPKALLPPYRTRHFEFETKEFGQITNEEGYWLTLRRLSPYGSVYAARFVNPKQRYEPR
jgi:hypothetical protein